MKKGETFPDRLLQAMNARGVKRVDLEEIAKRSTISEWFTQGSMPLGTTIVRLAERLDVSAEWLMEGRGPGPETVNDEPVDSAVPQAPRALATDTEKARAWDQLAEAVGMLLNSCRASGNDGKGSPGGEVDTQDPPRSDR